MSFSTAGYGARHGRCKPIPWLLFHNVDPQAAFTILYYAVGTSYMRAKHFFQHFDLPWLHYIDVMVFVLVNSVLMALAVNRLVFDNRAIFMFSREGRALRAAEV